MQRIARELNNSETAFILPLIDSTHDVHICFFTLTREVPICGHATIAAHYVRAVEMGLGNATLLHKTGADILPVEVIPGPDGYTTVMTQGAISFGASIEGLNLDTLIRALGLSPEDLRKGYPVQIVSTGHSKVMVCPMTRECCIG